MTSLPEKTVLVVDSDDGKSGWQKRIAGWLSDEFKEFKVLTAKTYDDALQYLSSQVTPFHFVVTEISLDQFDAKNQDGFKLANRIKELGQYTKTIILSHSRFADYNRTIVVSLTEKIISDFYEKEPADIKGFMLDDFLAGCKKVIEEAENARKQNSIDVFVLMPFARKYNATYALIQDVASGLGLTCKRSDDIPALGTIMKQVEKSIEQSRMVIADLSNKNLNVYFEAGISNAKGKPMILLARNKNDLAKLIEGNRVILYKDSLDGAEKLKLELKKQIEFILSGVNQPSHSHSSKKQEMPKSCLAITANSKAGEDTYKSIIRPMVTKEDVECQYVWDFYKAPKSKDATETIKDSLRSADLIVTDLAGRETDVYYLSGFAFGIDKYPIVLFDKLDEMPFDMKTVGKIPYSKDTEDDRNDARIELAKSIDILLNGDKMVKASKSKVKVFLNHATEDKPLVWDLYFELKKYPWIDPWIDEDRLLPGQELELEIDKAMKESDAVLVCISNTSVKKTGYVQAEIRKAEEQQNLRPHGAIYMIPVLLEPCKDQVPSNLQKLLWVDISDPNKINSIIKSLETLRK